MPKATTISTTSRRGLLAAAATAPVAGFPALAAAPDPHPALLAEAGRIWANSGAGPDDVDDAAGEAATAIEKRIASIPAFGPAGVLAKARLLKELTCPDDDKLDVLLARSLVADLERLLGGSA